MRRALPQNRGDSCGGALFVSQRTPFPGVRTMNIRSGCDTY